MSWTNETKPVNNVEYMATEALDYIMTEDGDYIITNQSVTFTNETKPSNSGWTNESK